MAAQVRLGDVHTWYAEHGAGEPLVMLHGGLGDSRDFDGVVGEFATRYRVFRPDRRGHGRTPDVEGPMSYALMAHDTIAFLESVVNGPAHLVGYSDGATVALQVALLRPDLVRRAVAISGVFHHEGTVPGILDDTSGEPAGLPDLIVNAYGEVSPDGVEHLPVVAAKVMRMAVEGPTLTVDDLAHVAVAVQVMVADDDIVALEHAVAMYRAIPRSELAVVPGTSHTLVFERPELCASLALDFVDGSVSAPMMPVRRGRPGPPLAPPER
ncbi:alpha/beta fold hydrolase [Nocardiopsis ansamitocini]|uniref:Alpha/beta hydrolase n=1 Tax=Nocardiopsis ansamitocini TaxID=1670832 RepID=A0A9W6P5R7_9ACTN|nr:alpha/beta hydrolase [Nocardiopsis ansamitocini]GLU47924.1 alpha/beta hydrolase [Nocardiopsis ansamitocini]